LTVGNGLTSMESVWNMDCGMEGRGEGDGSDALPGRRAHLRGGGGRAWKPCDLRQ
jgi:hypothetical protein